jgi:hypothetical protein
LAHKLRIIFSYFHKQLWQDKLREKKLKNKRTKSMIAKIILTMVLCFFLAEPVNAWNKGMALDEEIKYRIGKADGGPNIITYVGVETEFRGIALSPEVEIIGYEWDFEGDGVIDWQSRTTGVATYTFPEAGRYQAIFKAYDVFEKELPPSAVKVIVRKGKGKPVFIPKRYSHRSNCDKTEKEKNILKQKLGTTREEEEFLGLQINVLPGQDEYNFSISSQKVNSSLPSDGINQRYVIMINGGAEERFWNDVLYTYEMFLNYGIAEGNIYLLNYDGDAFDGTNPNNMIDYSATKENLQIVCNQLAALVDTDDLLYVWSTGHGRGYNGLIQPTGYGLTIYGYLDGVASVDSVDEQDYLENEFKLRSLFTGGDYHKGNHGMEIWRVYYKILSTGTYYYRHKYVSHFEDVYFIDKGLSSDNDIYIEKFIDYLEGDFNKNGIIESGELIDFDGDGVLPYDPNTDTYDYDDWGEIDEFEDDVRNINTGVPEGFSYTYWIIDYGLDNYLDIDLDHDPMNPEVNGTDLDNNGLFDGVDVNDDKDKNDWVSIDEKLCMYYDDLTDDELRAYLEPISAEVIVVTMMSCFSGGFIEDLAKYNRIIMTSTEEETVSWGNRFIRNVTSALSGLFYPGSAGDHSTADSNSDGHIDMAEVFNFAAENDYEGLEFPQYEDNGDGISHPYPVLAGGDGTLGSRVTLNLWSVPIDNNPPEIIPIYDKEVEESRGLVFYVRATDPDEDELTYSAQLANGGPLDEIGASFTTVVLGDFDNDGDVDRSDLSVFMASYGRKYCNGDCPGDFDNNGDMDYSDLKVFISNYGTTSYAGTKGGFFSWTPDQGQGIENYYIIFYVTDNKLDPVEEIVKVTVLIPGDFDIDGVVNGSDLRLHHSEKLCQLTGWNL